MKKEKTHLEVGLHHNRGLCSQKIWKLFRSQLRRPLLFRHQLRSTMGLRLPSELLFEVIAELVCDYVDFAITGPLPIEDCHQNLLPDRRHIHACLFVSSQFQEILLKVLFYTLGEDWRLVGKGISSSLNPHKVRTDHSKIPGLVCYLRGKHIT